MADTRPTFQQVRLQHQISISLLVTTTGLSLNDVLLIDQHGIGTPHTIDMLLKALSQLTDLDYNRRTVGGFSFSLQPDHSLLTANYEAEGSIAISQACNV